MANRIKGITVEIGGDTYQVELVYADNGSSTDKAVSAASKLVDEGDIESFEGDWLSGVVDEILKKQ